MTCEDFKKELNTNPKNVYCLVSTDSEMIDLYIDRFKKAINAGFVTYGEIKSKSFGKLLRKNSLNVIYMPKLDETVFIRPEYIFIHTDKIDKRTSTYKKYKNQIIELDNDYTNYVKKHTNFTDEQTKNFVRKCNNDLGIIKHNLELLELSELTYNDFIDYSNDIYLWVDNFIMKKELPNIEESPISIMALLSTNCQNLLKVKQNNTQGLNPYIVKNIQYMTKYRTEEELSSIISTCFLLDTKIKQGLIDINTVLNYLIKKEYRKEN